MTELQTSLFEAMKAFSDNAQQNSNATRTIEASIVAIVNEGLGEYTVNYLGQKFSAFSNNPNLVYSVDDKVFVLVPDNDFTKKKIILGLASEQLSYTTTAETDDGVTYYELSDNLFDFSKIDRWYSDWHLENGMLSLSSYLDISKYEEEIYINDYEDQFSVFNNGQLFAKNLNNYLKYSRILKLSFLVKINLLLERQNSGQYGIAFSGRLKNSYNSTYYTIDTNNMLGNPYKYNEWTPQTLYISIDEDAEFEENKPEFCLYFWVNGFPLTTEIPTGNDKFDIFIKDISLKSVTAIEQDDNGYILTLKATEGLYFNQNFKTVKTITPTLKVNGKTVNFMHDDSTEIYWFRQNSSIGVNDNKYCYYAGPCWECLNEVTNLTNNADGTVTYNWVKNVSTLEVNKRDVFDSIIYKCIIIYQGKQISADITLINSDSSAFVELNTETGSTKYVNGSGVVNFIVDVFMDGVTTQSDDRNNFSYYWGRFDKKNNLITDYVYWYDEESSYESDNGIVSVVTNEMVTKELRGTQLSCYESTFRIPVYLIDQSNTFYCTVKYIDKNNQVSIIGTKSITITTTNLEGYQLIVANENTLYKYDTDGDSPMGEAYDGPTTSKVTSIAPLTFKLNKPDGTELTDSEYAFLRYTWKIPKYSMFKINTNNLEEGEFTEDDNYYYITGNDGHKVGLSYGIQDRFEKTKAEKKLILIVEFNNERIEKEINIIFIKEGESGTNGTAYAAVLVSGSYDPDECVPYGNNKRLIYSYACNSGTTDFPLGFFNNENEYWQQISWGYIPYRIYPKVYKDSQLLKYNDDYDIEYSMFDSSESGMAKPILQIGDEDRDSVTGGILLTEVDSSVAPISPNEVSNCTILQAKITVRAGNVQNKGADSNDTGDYYEAPQIIYAYYPIDVYYFWSDSAITYIPIINGGFSQVMYEPDGTNPSYDDTKFVFDLYYQNNSVLNNGYYKLVHKNGPHLSDRSTADQNENGSDISVRLEPDMKYDDGNGGSYIALNITQDNVKWNLETLQEKASELQTKSDELEVEYNKYYYSKNQLNNFGYNFYFNDYINDLKNLQTFLELKNSGVDSLTQIINYINDLLQYISIQKTYNFPNIDLICASTLTALNSLLTEATTAIKQIDHLDGSEGYTKNDLISLADYIIELDKETIDLYKEQLNFSCAITIKTKVDDINNSINNSYQIIYNNLINLSSIDSNINTYNNIISSIEYACSQIDDTNLPEYIDLRDKILVYLEEFKKTSAINDLINILNQMYVNVLKNVFSLGGNLYFLDSTYRFFENKLNKIEEQQYKISNSLYYINYCIEYWNEGSANILAVYVRSISMYYNRYGMSNINGWDGNKIDTGDGSYLLAPQVGAGIKNDDNSFTGMLMGIRKPGAKQNASYDSHVGLFGYYYGKQTLFLNAQNGSALFGPPDGGQIIIDPTAKSNNIQTGETRTRGMIYSANYWKEYQSNGLPKNYNKDNENGQGLLIDFTEAEIKYGTGFFSVDNEGNMHAGGGGEGDVGGWDIYNTYLASRNFRDGISGIKLDAHDSQIIFGSESGSMYSGRHNAINSTQTGFYISNQGISINNVFRVTENAALELGNLSSNHWKIFGSSNGLTSYIKFGEGDFASDFSSEDVQSWRIITRQSEMGDTGNKAAKDNEVYLGTDGIRLGTKFAVNANGNMIASGAKFSGDITGSNISGSTITGGSLRIGDNFSVDNNGILRATGAIVNNLTANGITAHDANITGELTLGRDKMLSFIDELDPPTPHTILKYVYDDTLPYEKRWLWFETALGGFEIRFDDDVNARRYITGEQPGELGRRESYLYSDIGGPDIQRVYEAPQYKARYYEVTPVGDEDPQALGWYEMVSGSHYSRSMILSTDTTVNPNKHYYLPVHDLITNPSTFVDNPNPKDLCWYELINGEYVYTKDTYVHSSKTYYNSQRDYGADVERIFFFDKLYFYSYRDVTNEFRRTGAPAGATLYAMTYDYLSDIRQKIIHDELINTDISKNIICHLNPIAYEFIGKEGKYHRGFSAQEVEQILKDNDLPSMIYDYNEKDDTYYLSPTELIPDLVNCIQDLYKQIEELKEKLNEHTN